jgi:hypothetical protein
MEALRGRKRESGRLYRVAIIRREMKGASAIAVVTVALVKAGS